MKKIVWIRAMWRHGEVGVKIRSRKIGGMGGRRHRLQHLGCRGDEYNKDCGKCVKIKGVRKPHRKGRMTHTWSLSVDLSGPHPVATGTNFVYLLVAVLATEEATQRLPFVRGLTSKKGEEVASVIKSIITEVSAIIGEAGK